MIVFISDLEDEPNFVDFIIKNNIDLVLTFNSNSNNIVNSIKRLKVFDLSERKFDSNSSNNRANFTRTKISFKTDVTQIVDNVHKTILKDITINLASVDKFYLKPLPNNLKYASDDKSFLSSVLLKALNDTLLNNERIVLVCNDEKMACLIAICLINLKQAQKEGTFNVNMAAQTVISKLPKFNSAFLSPVNDSEINNNPNTFNLNRNDHELFFKPLFTLVKLLLFLYKSFK